MESYTTSKQICFIGKVWEIRLHLQLLTNHTPAGSMTLLTYLSNNNPRKKMPL